MSFCAAEFAQLSVEPGRSATVAPVAPSAPPLRKAATAAPPAKAPGKPEAKGKMAALFKSASK
ncbi:MAG: hypothetical protein P4L40_03445 [Terracidiphilus sp.]|nr:hypothetical protein [Terracidiphilus sp.]